MTSDFDIYRTANLLIKQRGAFDAEISATGSFRLCKSGRFLPYVRYPTRLCENSDLENLGRKIFCGVSKIQFTRCFEPSQ